MNKFPKTVECILCQCELENMLSDGVQPMGGTAFATNGHYGSGVFDPMNGSIMTVVICDACLNERSVLKQTYPVVEETIAVRYLPAMNRSEGPFGNYLNTQKFASQKEFVDWVYGYVCIHCLHDYKAFYGRDPETLGEWLDMGCGAEIEIVGDVNYRQKMTLPAAYFTYIPEEEGPEEPQPDTNWQSFFEKK